MITSKRFIQNISASTIQLVTNQATGLILFYLLSKTLDKASFGSFNWALAVLLICFGILQCGMDLLMVKKTASGESRFSILSLYISHVCLAGMLFYILLLVAYLLFPSGTSLYLLLFLGAGRLFIFLSTPFKQLCTGLEKFRLLLLMSVGSSLFKTLLLLVLYFLEQVSLKNILPVFIMGDFIELVITLVLSRKYLKAPLLPHFNGIAYRRLLKEGLPLLGTAVLAVGMARLDWVLIGIFLPAEKLAEYSFAYKAFELSTFPLLIIAPILVPWFSKIFRNNQVDETSVKILKALLSVELIIASFTSMILVLAWAPAVDLITAGKYGSVNRNTILLLSLCVSFLYLNNFFWTIQVSSSRLKEVFRVFMATFLVNTLGDLVLIPLFGNEGAAAAYLLSVVVQAVLFVRTTKVESLDMLPRSLFVYPLCALVSGLISFYFFSSPPAVIATAIGIYLVIVLFSLNIMIPQYKTLIKGTKMGHYKPIHIEEHSQR
ncbi:MAG: oligosaccharide flippase family protein [Williamsia sp.]|nr:oligosaccharide flippase family protein [Williamsia sp.]